jgi:DNA (cytosine-5)-methyltransferase 1
MGFPENFIFPVSETQAMKQLGNSVAVNAVQATAKSLLDYITEHYSLPYNTLERSYANG